VELEDQTRSAVQKIAEMLRQRIAASGFSLRDVEERLGLERDSLDRLLHRSEDLKLEHVLAVMGLLGESPAELFLEVYGVARL
jgi:transcriptional regulator with XRE-family HTH domain